MRTHDEFLADVAAVYIRDQGKMCFGSGRLIAPDLVLTAGHVVDYPTREAPARAGWKIALIGERDKDGRWRAPAHDAEVVWRGKGDLDLALLRLIDGKRLEPKLTPEFALYGLVGPLGETDAAGFPDAWVSEADAVRDYFVRGNLRVASQRGPYGWSVQPADKPDDPHGWKGMSGSAVCRFGSDGKLYLFGIVQEIPANFSEGLLDVARISYAFEDGEFRSQLQTALRSAPVLSAFEPARSWADLGIARIFQTRTRAFTDEYLVSETGPVPFGGRDAELRRLDAWLFDPQSPPRMLVTAPAGRGKSALLVRWMKNLQDGGVCGADGWQLAFMPISIRTGTNRPGIFYEGLARRLAEITRVALPKKAFRDSDGFRYAVRDQLDRLGSDGKQRALVTIDGVDEALEGSFDPDILPTPLPTNIRILLSARWQFGDQNSDGWLERLGWDRGVKVETFEVDRLGATQIADVLVKLPADVLVREPGLVERLAQLTEGEPLLVRYYAEDLWTASGKGARITRADLEHLKPGFDSYFKRWFDLQEKLWKEEGGHVDWNKVDAVLSVMAFALGPLSDADLVTLVERIHNLKGVIAVDRVLNPLRRWVFGGGQSDAGYVLSHPKIGDYLQRNRFVATATQLRQGFADWGKAHCIALNQGRIALECASPYCLQFLPEHLKQARASPEDFMIMVENGWRLAWEAFDGGQRGFASAVKTAFAAQKEDRSSRRLGARWRCALTLSSINSLGQNVPAKLLLAAVDKGVLTNRQAAHFAELKGPSEVSVELLSGLALAARDNPALRSELLVSAVAAAKAIGDERARAEALIALAPHLAPKLRDEALREALAAAGAIDDEYSRALALTALAPHLAPEQVGEALAAAKATKAIYGEHHRAQALAALAPHLAPEQVGEALAAAGAIGDDDTRAGALAAVAPYLRPEKRDEGLREALAAARAIGDDWHRAQVLAALAPHLGPEQRDQALLEALAAARAIDFEYSRALALEDLAPRLAPEQVGEALAAAEAIRCERDRARALAALAPRLAPEQRDEALREALAAAKAIDDEHDRAEALDALASHLAPELLGEALAAAKAIGHDYDRETALTALAPHLAPEQVGEALAAAKAIGDEGWRALALEALAPRLAPEQVGEELAAAKAMGDADARAWALVALAPHLAPEQLGEALAAAKAIGDEYACAEALAALAPHLAPEQRDEALREALAAAKWIRDDNDRAWALVALAPHLAPKQAGEAVAAAKAIGDERARAQALAALAPHLAPEQRDEGLREALAAANAISYEPARAWALVALAPNLEPEQLDEALREALAAAEAIGDADARAGTLAALAPHLAPEQLREALAAAKVIGEHWHRAQALADLAPHLAPEQRDEALREALAAAGAIDFETARAVALAALAPHLAPEQLGEALAAAKAIGDEGARTHALAALAPHLAPEQVGEALAAAKAIGDEYDPAGALAAALAPELAATHAIYRDDHRAEALAALAPRLAPAQADEALAAAEAIGYEGARAQALAALAPHLAPEQRDQVIAQAIDAVSVVSRSSTLNVAKALASPTCESAGQGAIIELFHAIKDVCSWYP